MISTDKISRLKEMKIYAHNVNIKHMTFSTDNLHTKNNRHIPQNINYTCDDMVKYYSHSIVPISLYDLYSNELKTINFTQPKTISEFKSCVSHILNRYSIVLKTILEDKWKYYDYDSCIGNTEYELKPNEFIFINSVSLTKFEDDRLRIIMSNVKQHIQTMGSNLGIKVSTKFCEDIKVNICWIIYKCSLT